MHEVSLHFKLKRSEVVYDALLPEATGSREVELRISGSVITLILKKKSISNLRAALNTWLRLVSISTSLIERGEKN